jgi:hypothetical protein
MVALNSITLLLASDAIVRTVFKEILKNRSAVFRDLLGSVRRLSSNEEDSRLQVENAVTQLKAADLIEERRAPIEDFNSYYVTADGLTAERQLRLGDRDI